MMTRKGWEGGKKGFHLQEVIMSLDSLCHQPHHSREIKPTSLTGSRVYTTTHITAATPTTEKHQATHRKHKTEQMKRTES